MRVLPPLALSALALAGVLGLVLALPEPAGALIGGTPAHVQALAVERHETGEAVRWGFLIGLGVETLGILALMAMKVEVLTMLIGKDGRVSTSKTIAVVWTLVVAAALLGVVYADLLSHPGALTATEAAGVMGQYALLFGGPLGAAILAKGIVSGQASKDPTAKPPATSTSVADLVQNDAEEVDLGDFQYVLFNAVALVYVLGMMLLRNPAGGLPHIPEVLLGLTSVSAAGYVGKKALPNETPASAKLDVRQGAAGTLVSTSIEGLSPPQQSAAKLWVRFGENDPGQVPAGSVQVVDGRTRFSMPAPPLLPAPLQPPPALPHPVDVSIVTASGAVISAGKFTYT